MKPMLASHVTNFDKLRFPLLASPKLDGIRAMVVNGVLVSRSFKPIRNSWTQNLFGTSLFEGVDGELILGKPTAPTVFRDTTSAVMSEAGVPKNICFYVFDHHLSPTTPFIKRYQNLDLLDAVKHVQIVPQIKISSLIELERYERQCLEEGYEGVMLRDPNGRYKYGRSTEKEGLLLKVKRFRDDEAKVIGFEEQYRNDNELQEDAFGYAKRSGCQDNLVGKDTLGALRVVSSTGVVFSIGSGLDNHTRKLIWNNKSRYLNQIVKYKHFTYGNYDKPRFPVFLGFREEDDL